MPVNLAKRKGNSQVTQILAESIGSNFVKYLAMIFCLLSMDLYHCGRSGHFSEI